MAVQWQPDPQGMSEYLRTNPELRNALAGMARQAAEFARSIAPVGDPATDPHSGAYRDSINAEVHDGPSRMVGRCSAADQKAHWIEYGAAHMPKMAVLRRALDHVAGVDDPPETYPGQTEDRRPTS
jgi:hypothetical protein